MYAFVQETLGHSIIKAQKNVRVNGTKSHAGLKFQTGVS